MKPETQTEPETTFTLLTLDPMVTVLHDVSSIQTNLSDQSDTEINHTDWSGVFWLSGSLLFTGVVVVVAFNYIH